MSGKIKIAFYTLGCKLNFSETSTIKRLFNDEEFEKVNFNQPADIYVINTCSVTAAADKKCRHAIYQATANSPGSLVVVTGCYAQLQAEKLSKIKGVDIVLGENEKFRIKEYLGNLKKRNKTEIFACETSSSDQFFPSWSIGDRTRSFLKIQDGCDYMCSYCTIPLARGKSRNAPVSGIVADALKIAGSGISEIVLTGVNIGDFGRTTGETFFELIKALNELDGIERFRISSIEPELLTHEMIEFIASSGKFAHHFHVPLQSGSDKILKLMRRRYKTSLFELLVQDIKNTIPSACIGTDVITGFPSETGEDFEDTFRFLEMLDLSYVHVFSFSVRPGTKAAEIPDRTDPKETDRRSRLLHELSFRKKTLFYRQNIGTTAVMIPEDRRTGNNMQGFTGNYIQTEIPWNAELINKPVRVYLESINPDGNMKGIVSQYESS